MSRMRRAAVALLAVAALGGCGNLGTPTTASPAAVLRSFPPPSTSSSPASSTALANPRAAATTSQAPIAAPTVVTGSGDALVPVTKPAGTTTVIATITGNAAYKHFYVRALGGEQGQLVATTAPYSGSVLLDPDGGSSTQLRIRASGPWSITLSDPRSAPVFTDTYRGSGDAVLVYQGPLGEHPAVRADVTGTSLQLTVYSGGGATTLLRATGPWSGAVQWPFRVGLVAVRATGAWSLTVDQTR